MKYKIFLGNLTNGRNNNFDIIRFIAAVLVIFSHSFPLSLKSENKYEPLNFISGNQSTIGHLAVLVFFITSGFLITQSFKRSSSLFTYLKSRVLRIYPALLVAVLITVFILGPIVTSVNLNEYFSNSKTINYLKTLLLLIQFELPGVFEKNAYVKSVNGSLWTIQYEFFFYIVVAGLGVFKLLNKKMMTVIFLITYLISIIGIPNGQRLVDMFSYFSAGMLIYLYKDKLLLSNKFAALSAFVVIISIFFGGLEKLFVIFGSYLVIFFSFSTKFRFYNFGKYGDFSYGLYIFAFPTQQCITQLFGYHMNPLVNFFIAFPITLIFAVLSWYFVEKPALKLKKVHSFFVSKNNAA